MPIPRVDLAAFRRVLRRHLGNTIVQIDSDCRVDDVDVRADEMIEQQISLDDIGPLEGDRVEPRAALGLAKHIPVAAGLAAWGAA